MSTLFLSTTAIVIIIKKLYSLVVFFCFVLYRGIKATYFCGDTMV